MQVFEFTVIIPDSNLTNFNILDGVNYDVKGDQVKIYCKDFAELKRVENLGLVNEDARIVRVKDGIAHSIAIPLWYVETKAMLAAIKDQPIPFKRSLFIDYVEKWVFPFFELYSLSIFRKFQSALLGKLKIICEDENFPTRIVDAAKAIVESHV